MTRFHNFTEYGMRLWILDIGSPRAFLAFWLDLDYRWFRISAGTRAHHKTLQIPLP